MEGAECGDTHIYSNTCDSKQVDLHKLEGILSMYAVCTMADRTTDIIGIPKQQWSLTTSLGQFHII